MRPFLDGSAALALSIALALGPARLAAQYTPQTPQASFGVAGMETMGETATAVQNHGASYCPVALSASHLADGTLRNAASDHPSGIGQKLRLSETANSRKIASAEITVRGSTAEGQITQTKLSRQPHINPFRALTVRFSAAPDGSSFAEFWVPGLTAVQAIDLKSVTFTDGATWRVVGNGSCRVIPDPLLLVSSR